MYSKEFLILYLTLLISFLNIFPIKSYSSFIKYWCNYKSIFCNNRWLYKFLKNYKLYYSKEFLILYLTILIYF